MAELEERSLTLASVFLALMDADVLVLQLAQILTIIGEEHAAMADVREMVGDVPEADMVRGFSWLEERNLVSRLPGSLLCVHGGLLSIGGAGALGPPAADLVKGLSASRLSFVLGTIGRRARNTRKAAQEDGLMVFLRDHDAVRTLVGRAPPEVRRHAESVAAGSTPMRLPWDVGDPYRTRAPAVPSVWLLQRGLAYMDSRGTAVMPREVGLALRGGRPFPATSYRRPQIVLHPAAATGPAGDEVPAAKAVEAVERLIDAWGSKPARLLKSDGIGVREVRRLTAVMDLPESDIFRLIEMAAAAGLIVADTRQGRAVPTAAADEWLDFPVADRWWVLAQSWLETSMYPSLAGAMDYQNKVVPALGYARGFESEASDQRRGVLTILLELPEGSGADVDSVAEVAVWNAPMRWEDVPGTPTVMVAWTLAEMELLGLALDGMPTALARAVVDRDIQKVRDRLADPGAGAWQLVLQADLTALVSGRAPSSVRAELEVLGDVEARGAATLYRFNQASVRRAFDAGRSSAQILQFLAEHSAKGLPQPLTYLVEDVDRRYGQARIGRAGCYVRFDDPALAAEVVRGRQTSKLGLRQIAPTVLVCDQPNTTVLGVLRTAGYLPVVESDDGSAVHTPVARHRVETPQTAGQGSTGSLVARAGVSGGGTAERWRSQRSLGAHSASAHPDIAALAAALLRTAGESPPTFPHGRDQARAGRGVEIPTMLRRPARGVEEPMGLGAEIEVLAELLAGGLDSDSDDSVTLMRRLIEFEDEFLLDDSPEDDSHDDAELDGDQGAFGEAQERPTEIFHDPAEIAHLVRLADEEEWLLRLSYTAASGKSSEVTVFVIGVSGSVVEVQVAPRWTDQRYVLERINWARAMTEAEEGAMW